MRATAPIRALKAVSLFWFEFFVSTIFTKIGPNAEREKRRENRVIHVAIAYAIDSPLFTEPREWVCGVCASGKSAQHNEKQRKIRKFDGNTNMAERSEQRAHRPKGENIWRSYSKTQCELERMAQMWRNTNFAHWKIDECTNWIN